jgi:hypothetical protein
MLRWLVRRTVSAFERQWNYDASYLRDLIDASPRAAWRFLNAARLGSYRRDVPIEALAAAGITAVRSEDCVRAPSWRPRWLNGKGSARTSCGPS